MLERSAPYRHGSGVVPRVGVLLVRRIVLLVDADDAEPGHGGEDRRAGPDDDRRVPGGDALALVTALGFAEPRVETGDPVAEAGPETGDGLRGERDLGDEHDRAEASLEGRRAGSQVHLRLAAAGLAVEEKPPALPHGGFDALERLLLGVREHGRNRLVRHLGDGGSSRLPAAAPGRRRDERKRARRGRSVVGGDPERELDERRRDTRQHAVHGNRLHALRRRVGEARRPPRDGARGRREPTRRRRPRGRPPGT